MAERARAVKVKREIVAREYGHWCGDCNLGSGMRIYVAVWINMLMHLQVHMLCDDCGGSNVAVAPDAPDARGV